MVALAPLAIVIGTILATGLLFYSFWDGIVKRLGRLTSYFADDLDRAGLRIGSERIVVGIIGFSLCGWIFLIIFVHPNVVLSSLGLAGLLGVAICGFRFWIRRKGKRRAKAFNDQLEMVLRLIANGLRVGLSVQQALVVVTEELVDPARGEFARVFAQTSIGVSLNDALDALAGRMPSDELRMLADAIRVQSQMGGNLTKILDHLAMTIKGRRAVARKIKSLIGESVAGAWVLGALPLLVGGYILLAQPGMRSAMIGTAIGHLGLILFTVLEGLGIFTLSRLLAFDV
jgi:tight adherence protein B